MRILGRRDYPGLATLYAAQFGHDRARVAEFVDTLEPGVPKNRKWVMQVSTQLGCVVGCRMCDAGALSYRGNLSADEILGQIRHIAARQSGLNIARHPKVKIHFSRMGEPSLNPAVLEALKSLAREFPYPGILPVISTVAPKSPAIAPFFEELISVKDEFFSSGRFQLQFSLHSLDETTRRRIVPIKKWALEEIAAYAERFLRRGDRKITLSFALSSEESLDPGILGALFSRDRFLIKITPVNPTQTALKNEAVHLWSEAPEPIRRCVMALEAAGFSTVTSPSLPEEISARTSCGQLWAKALEESAALTLKNRALPSGS